MDDINIMSTSVAGAQDLLARCSKALKWAGMDYRADKSRSIVIIKGKTMNTTPFTASEPANSTDFSCHIPSIQSMPVNFLGRIIDGSISDRKALDELQEKLFEGLKIIYKSSFKGTQMLWILQHLLIPRVQWTLMIYEVSMTFALRLEQNIGTKPLRKIFQYCKKDLSNITEDVVDDSIFDVEGKISVTVKDGHVMDIDINSVASEDVVDDSFFDVEKSLV